MADGAEGAHWEVSKRRFIMLERIKDHLAQQNWTAVVLEFVIVVVGVALGFQITEWNRGQLAEGDYQIARDRLIDETRENIEKFEEYREFFVRKKQIVGEAIAVLETCESGEEARSKVITGIEMLRQTNQPIARVAAAQRITDDPALISRQPEDERLRLERLHETLVTSNGTVNGIADFNDIRNVDNHPFVGFGDFYIGGLSGGFEQRRPTLTAPLSQVCRDSDFQKLFYLAERRVNFLVPFTDDRIALFRDNLDAMGASELVVAK